MDFFGVLRVVLRACLDYVTGKKLLSDALRNFRFRIFGDRLEDAVAHYTKASYDIADQAQATWNKSMESKAEDYLLAHPQHDKSYREVRLEFLKQLFITYYIRAATRRLSHDVIILTNICKYSRPKNVIAMDIAEYDEKLDRMKETLSDVFPEVNLNVREMQSQ